MAVLPNKTFHLRLASFSNWFMLHLPEIGVAYIQLVEFERHLRFRQVSIMVLFIGLIDFAQSGLAQIRCDRTYYPVKHKCFGLAEGLSDPRVDLVFRARLGKLNLVTCQHEQVAYDQSIYQFAGFKLLMKDARFEIDHCQELPWHIVVKSLFNHLIVLPFLSGNLFHFGAMAALKSHIHPRFYHGDSFLLI